MIKKLTLLNRTILDSLKVDNDVKIVKAFTEVGVEILGADFGFAWFFEPIHRKWLLAYKTANLPFEPIKPTEKGRNFKTVTSGKIHYVKNLKKTLDTAYVSSYMRSFAIIPILYRENAYGTIVLCFKNHESFPQEKRMLSTFLGNGVAQAITVYRSQKNAEQAKATEILLEQEKVRTEFIANATHELRTPLAIIKGNIDLALLETGRNKQKYMAKAFKNIDKEIIHLSNIVSDMALLTSVSSNGNPFENKINPVSVNVSKLLYETARRFRDVYQKKKITIHTKIEKDITILGDKTYLEKLFSNLIKNAITYGKEGGWVKVEATKKRGVTEIKISDNGIGISSEDLPYIFNRFYRADKSHSSAGKRTGLGLSIVNWVAQVHGGEISVASTLGKGSVFTVLLPVKNSY